MDFIDNIDKEWYWLGYIIGGNGRKSKVETPNKIVNLGKQGVVRQPTEKQKVSFYIGLQIGRRKVVQNFNVVRVIQYQTKDSYKSKGDYLTAQIGSIETEAGTTFTLPFYICNNSVDNRGFIGYQYKIKYPTQYLTLNSITPSSTWSGSFNYQHDAEGGVVLVQGLNEVVSYEDCVFGYLNFTLSADAKGILKVNMCGPSGKGTATDILTQINGENYYIQPLTLKDGEIKILGDGEEPDPTEPPIGADIITLPPIGTTEDPIGTDTDFTYDFDLDLRYAGGGEGSGANLGVNITFGDGTTTTVYIPLQEGSHHYSGKIPIRLPFISKGPVIIEIWVEPEDENDLYYWFIKAGALWGFETEIKREDVGELPIIPPHIQGFDNLVLYDDFEIETIAPGPEPTPAVSDLELYEIMQLLDGFTVEQLKELSSEVIDALLVSDSAAVEHLVMVKKSETEDFLISDGLEIEWFI